MEAEGIGPGGGLVFGYMCSMMLEGGTPCNIPTYHLMPMQNNSIIEWQPRHDSFYTYTVGDAGEGVALEDRS
jgi:hypothetical protein